MQKSVFILLYITLVPFKSYQMFFHLGGLKKVYCYQHFINNNAKHLLMQVQQNIKYQVIIKYMK